MSRVVIQGDKVRDVILEGSQLLYDAVSVTYGPKGQNAIIERYGEPDSTHDGVTVAKAIYEMKDLEPGVSMGIELLKLASKQTNDTTGDGTTTSTILGHHLIKEGHATIKSGKNPMVLRRELDAACQEILTNLKPLAEPIDSVQKAINIATISSESTEIGKIVGELYYKLGAEGIVTVENGYKPGIKATIVEGYSFERGLTLPHLANDVSNQSYVEDKPSILVTNAKIDIENLKSLVEELYQVGKTSLVIVASDYSATFMGSRLQEETVFKIIPIKAPHYGEERDNYLADIATVCGTTVLKDNFKAESLGTCGKITVKRDETIISGGADVKDYVALLKTTLKDTDATIETERKTRRIAKLESKVGFLTVGGITEVELAEKKYLIEDALAATKAALLEGIVPGGATTYLELAKLTNTSDGAKILIEALKQPFKLLMMNAGELAGVKIAEITKFGQGFDVMGTGELVDLKELGVIDPVLVVKEAIVNAVSAAGSALTTGVIIAEVKDNEKED